MSGTELIQKWDNCLVFIRDNVSEAVYNAWFTVIKPISMENGELTVQVPSAFVYEYLEHSPWDIRGKTSGRAVSHVQCWNALGLMHHCL